MLLRHGLHEVNQQSHCSAEGHLSDSCVSSSGSGQVCTWDKNRPGASAPQGEATSVNVVLLNTFCVACCRCKTKACVCKTLGLCLQNQGLCLHQCFDSRHDSCKQTAVNNNSPQGHLHDMLYMLLPCSCIRSSCHLQADYWFCRGLS